jgi:hypothetical protein
MDNVHKSGDSERHNLKWVEISCIVLKVDDSEPFYLVNYLYMANETFGSVHPGFSPF